MPGFYYEVCVTFTDSQIADNWLAWMRDEHINDVIKAGAKTGRAILVDPENSSASLVTRMVAQYEFESRTAFDAYVRDHAPRLRAEGLKRFPTDQVTYQRRSGEIKA